MLSVNSPQVSDLSHYLPLSCLLGRENVMQSPANMQRKEQSQVLPTMCCLHKQFLLIQYFKASMVMWQVKKTLILIVNGPVLNSSDGKQP